ncbi:MAG: Asp-tRNA(Asn)/Glu-tRNA(Gln) amidotransferase subunit GatA, partial [Actinobacteria bacterium]|nr:Asp-tRNA(Asn)/Glu-tRNA(Gln) amidotransferase subunit GatA [Actinomycetota bacterium]
MSDLTRQSAATLASAIARKEVSSEEVTRAHLDRIAQVDERVHAFLHVDRESSIARAREVDQQLAKGELSSPLAGVPIALKDLLATKGVPTTCGSRILEGWRPPYNATIVDKLNAAGVVSLGKTNMDEFAMGSSTEHSGYGPTQNPWDLERIPGGSGGGSAAAVASFESPMAIGTDTGGSIRQPAALTGTVGVKPTYGGVSRYGIVALASSLDQAGPCARDVMDTALLHTVIGGHDPRDSTSINKPVPDVVAAALNADVRGMKIGVIK